MSVSGNTVGDNTYSETPRSWQRDMAEAVRSPADLLNHLDLNRRDIELAGLSVDDSPEFPLLVPLSFLNRMRPGDPNDPLLLQVLPLQKEQSTAVGFVGDAVEDAAARRAPGLLQKYQGRALLIAAGSCAVHCRYCFRREYPYSDEPHRLDDWEPALREIEADTSLTEIICSGGDPLMLNDHRLRILCSRVDDVPHIERIRFHTRLPIVLPSRISPEFVSLLQSLRSQPIVVVHANHPNEVVGDCSDALRALVRAGIPVLNQAVLLRGINDNIEALEALSRKLIRIGVMPYYLHQLDRVSGTSHFEVPIERGRELVRELQRRLPGYAVPRFVQEIPGQLHKTPLLVPD
jgi:L-lysine 2,3-aminomutase